jgi:hypothetical protein
MNGRAHSRGHGPTRARCWLPLGWARRDHRYHGARPAVGNRFLAGTSWLSPGWNQPWADGREAADCFNSAADSYADRPQVPNPHALPFMRMTPAARYRAMARFASPRPLAVPARVEALPVPRSCPRRTAPEVRRLTLGTLEEYRVPWGTCGPTATHAPAPRGRLADCLKQAADQGSTRSCLCSSTTRGDRGTVRSTSGPL